MLKWDVMDGIHGINNVVVQLERVDFCNRPVQVVGMHEVCGKRL